MSYNDIELLKDEAAATIVVDRPKFRNAVRYETMLEINTALDDIEADPNIRVVVITGSGDKAFVSGGDITVMAEDMSYVDTLQSINKGQDVITRIEYFPKPVVARINGYALGGGSEIALGCDIRIASENAFFGFPEITLGIIPGYGGTQRLPRALGMGPAKALILTGDRISARQALEAGLVSQVVSQEDLDKAVSGVVEKLAARPPVALHMAKTAMNNGIQADLRTGLDIESRCYSLCFGTRDRSQGMNAFLEKRTPVFEGR